MTSIWWRIVRWWPWRREGYFLSYLCEESEHHYCERHKKEEAS